MGGAREHWRPSLLRVMVLPSKAELDAGGLTSADVFGRQVQEETGNLVVGQGHFRAQSSAWSHPQLVASSWMTTCAGGTQCDG